jgi:hypothetical protein
MGIKKKQVFLSEIEKSKSRRRAIEISFFFRKPHGAHGSVIVKRALSCSSCVNIRREVID